LDAAYSIDISSEEIETFGSDVSLGRPGQPDEIAPSFVFLASGTSGDVI